MLAHPARARPRETRGFTGAASASASARSGAALPGLAALPDPAPCGNNRYEKLMTR